ncbi:nucleoside-diphosphate kinase [Candidatus Kuenenbacteria bacterium CG11_big_fil_rev_8_21_14_0_20_37_9]|uniref:nucleoside-diphosphate kinase n=2 Tax=Candidatus Kueneniibacteriota TaxID=1752740 RepID=A0A2M6XT22_9BACT|nr:MAG: nucleoside-diphosphate kinase [Candidatus Kuenenbacteria bacterium CG1_02_38_13]PIR05946.1 MAG: nucleoside-diphosphate kinase [Candidatus Kuenenbacteria bacterium CG11_big_fil_rev_8_21_14_0_20_37_9]PIU10786.1 MAG: nucleoside-diphosphate kinase [Candidatus Kuenenbacteria bacterium CG08_land_8_20_14_0_20_37_23]
MLSPKEEKTVLLIKPDGVKRGIVGDIISRIEQRGLKLIALKMLNASKGKARSHYPGTDTWLIGMGNKTLENYEKYGKDPIKELGSDDPKKIGDKIYDWNVEYLTSGPMVAVLIKGLHAIDMVRKIVGHTLPSKADMGTVRGDYSVDSPTLANGQKRAIRNIVHASGDLGEATHEIKHWFKEDDICDYKRSDEDIMF